MKEKPIIGIIGRCINENDNSVITTNENYRLAIVKSGGIPFIIIPTDVIKYGKAKPKEAKRLIKEEKNDLYQILNMCDGILMTGGSCWYQFDELICKYALDNNIPILGICLGMQILGSVDNFDGINDSDKTIKNETRINHSQDNARYVHECILENGMLKDILKVNKIKVNSRHHYHIEPKNYFHIDAYSEDGIIESIHIPNHKFALGVQWHPETMLEYNKNMKKIFDAFIESAKTN